MASEVYGNWGQFKRLQKLDFVIHETGADLDTPWTISNDPNEYLVESKNHESSDPTNTIRYIYKYISCLKHDYNDITEKISVGINIPGVGKFNTTQNGTSTKGKSGQVFKSPKSYEITAIRPIDYRNHDNLHIINGELKEIANGLKWVSRLTTEGPLKEHSDGVCKQRIVYIRPNKSVTGQEKFKHHEIVYDPIKNDDVSTGTIYWWWGTNTHEPCFSLIDDCWAQPGAVIGRDYGDDDYQLNLWFSRRNDIKICGKFYVVDHNYYYQFNADIEELHMHDDEDGAATLLLYKFVMPEDKTYKWKWQNVIRNITVNVTDHYGNDGSIQLSFDDKDNFDKPGFV